MLESEAFLLLDESSDPIFSFYPDGRYRYVNKAFAQGVGLPHTEIIGKTIWNVFEKAEADKRFAIVKQVFATGEEKVVEVRVPRPDEDRYYLTNLKPIKDTSDRVISVICISKDITLRKRNEEALRQLSQQLLQSQDDERQRIARELHDSTAQALVGLLLNLGALKKHLDSSTPAGKRLLEECMTIATQSLREVRTLSFLLHSPHLEDLGVAGAIQNMAEEFGRRSGIAMRLDLPEERLTLPNGYDLTLYRIVQEALTNIHQHSGSKSATIRLSRKPECIRLEIQDHGHGMSPPPDGIKATNHQSGVGITSMRERLRQVGGHLDIVTGKSGTTVVAVLPIGNDPRI